MKKLIFATQSNAALAGEVAKKCDAELGSVYLGRFADGEIAVQLRSVVQERAVYVIGSSFPPADNFLELLILIHALKANNACQVDVIMPYFGYAKADRIKHAGDSMAAGFAAKALSFSGADSVAAVNIHSELAAGFFQVPFLNVDAIGLLADVFKAKNIENPAIVAPDAGGIPRAERFAAGLGAQDIVYITKSRPEFDKVVIENVSGKVEGRNVIIVDDMVQSGGTLIKAAAALKARGAKDIFVAVVHMLFSGPGADLLEKDGAIKEVVFTDSVPGPHRLPPKMQVVSIVKLLSGYIKE